MERHPLLRDPETIKDLSIKGKLIATNTEGRARYNLTDNFKEKRNDCIRALQAHLLIDAALASAPPGYYTWILKDISSGQHTIAAPTYSKQEIGTLHHNLDKFTMHGPVPIAGELHISEDRVYTYNILSGSYTNKLPKEIQADRLSLFLNALLRYGVPERQIQIRPFAPILESANPILSDALSKLYVDTCGMTRTPQTGGRRKSVRKARRRT
jgi:hypothetical protein